MKEFTIAVLGATGAVGREMVKVLEEYQIPVKELRLLASARSAGSLAPRIFSRATPGMSGTTKSAFFASDSASRRSRTLI